MDTDYGHTTMHTGQLAGSLKWRGGGYLIVVGSMDSN